MGGVSRKAKDCGVSRFRGESVAVLDDPAAASPELEAERQRYANDPKAFYTELLASNAIEGNTPRRECLGDIHNLFLDFLTFEVEGVKRYSSLQELMPPKDENGNYAERWIYFPTLAGPIEIQDGPIGDISKMFRENPWQGCVIRICGDGLNKCALLPRGFLKSELGSKMLTLWRIVRNPTTRTLMRSVGDDLATKFVSFIKQQFDLNEKFRRLWKHLRPYQGEGVWRTDELQVVCPMEERRGHDYTVQAKGGNSEIVGGHYDFVILDDVVAENNSHGAELEKTTTKVINLYQANDPQTNTLDLGTRWEENDTHRLFIDPDSEMSQDSSFMTVTVIDADPNGVCHDGIAGRGNPMWPEKITAAVIAAKRRKTPILRTWYGQQFNQYTGTTLRTFDRAWIRHYPETCAEMDPDWMGEPGAVLPRDPVQLARKLKLNIFFAVDTATGKDHLNDRMDYTAGFVLGQTQDRRRLFFLDGFKERLAVHQIPVAIVKKALFWRRVADDSNARFSAGFEEVNFTNFLLPLLEAEQRKLGSQTIFPFALLKHNLAAKLDRIRVLARPYSENNLGGAIYWPETLTVQPFGKGEPYDIVAELEDEFCKYPSVAHDDLLDAHAYAFEMADSPSYSDQHIDEPAGRPKTGGSYWRDQIQPGEETREEMPDFDDNRSAFEIEE